MARRNTYREDEVLETPFDYHHLLRAFVYIKKYLGMMIFALILSAIGGDDTYQTVPYLLEDGAFKKLVSENPKLFMGYSDTSINHLMFQKLGLATYYGPAAIVDFGEFASDMLAYTEACIRHLFSDDAPALEAALHRAFERCIIKAGVVLMKKNKKLVIIIISVVLVLTLLLCASGALLVFGLYKYTDVLDFLIPAKAVTSEDVDFEYQETLNGLYTTDESDVERARVLYGAILSNESLTNEEKKELTKFMQYFADNKYIDCDRVSYKLSSFIIAPNDPSLIEQGISAEYLEENKITFKDFPQKKYFPVKIPRSFLTKRIGMSRVQKHSLSIYFYFEFP